MPRSDRSSQRVELPVSGICEYHDGILAFHQEENSGTGGKFLDFIQSGLFIKHRTSSIFQIRKAMMKNVYTKLNIFAGLVLAFVPLLIDGLETPLRPAISGAIVFVTALIGVGFSKKEIGKLKKQQLLAINALEKACEQRLLAAREKESPVEYA